MDARYYNGPDEDWTPRYESDPPPGCCRCDRPALEFDGLLGFCAECYQARMLRELDICPDC